MNTSQINDLINELCVKFGTTTQYLIGEYARYSIVKDIAKLLICSIFIACSVKILLWVYKRYKIDLDKYENGSYEYNIRPDILDDYGWWVVGAGVTLIITMIIWAFCIVDLIGWIASPTAAFFEVVLHLLRNN